MAARFVVEFGVAVAGVGGSAMAVAVIMRVRVIVAVIVIVRGSLAVGSAVAMIRPGGVLIAVPAGTANMV